MKGEGVRQTGVAMVVAVTPDVCLTPMGATPVPVPYPIVGWFSNCAIVAQTVRMCGRPTFTTASKVTNVTGDEAGTAGGVKSGMNMSVCESITASTTVKAEGNRVLRHGDQMKMNNGNTIGTVVYMPFVGPVLVGEPSDDGPPAWKVLLGIDGLGSRLEAFGDEAVDTAKGLKEQFTHQLGQLGRILKCEPGALDDVVFEDLSHLVKGDYGLIGMGRHLYGAYKHGGWDEVRGRGAFQVFMALVLHKAGENFGGPKPNRALPSGERPALGPGDSPAETPSSERPTAETGAADPNSSAEPDYVDPESTAKMKVPDGVTVKGNLPGPKTGGKYADMTIEMTEYGKNWDAQNPVEIYKGAELEARRVVAGPNGELVYAKTGRQVGNGNYIYVMDKNGNVYMARPQRGVVHHSSLAGGEDPVAGGHMDVANGKPAGEMNEVTGHYGYGGNQPTGRSDVVYNELADQGVDMSGTQTKHYVPPPSP